jgi:hypothetical protein
MKRDLKQRGAEKRRVLTEKLGAEKWEGKNGAKKI